MADINVGAISEALNNKADLDLHNLNNEGKKSVTLTGMVMAFAGTTAPSGWLKCDGSAISRATYAKLFAAIGGLYGTGDGSTTFNLPDLNGRVPFGMFGEYIGKSTNGVLPNITGNINGISEEFAQMGTASGAFRKENNITQNTPTFSGDGNSGVISFNASRSNSIYGNGWFGGERVVPASVGMTYCIKY
jgi:microcystin-dependent protein